MPAPAKTSKQIQDFQKLIWDFYKAYGRNLAWRLPEPDASFDPYKILVSEVMLQQTQVSRVTPKYQAFLAAFPTVKALAQADLAQVLRLWSGLGYNRRAKFLHETAKVIDGTYSGVVPNSPELLEALPGIGKNTAAAIYVYSFNQPEVFIETNIRTVFLHHFFKDQTQVSDSQLLPYIEAALDHRQPRQWYFALMDYGSFLKRNFPNPSSRSKHFTRQPAFAGSRRFVRGQIIKLLTQAPLSLFELAGSIKDERLMSVLGDLQNEGLIAYHDNLYRLGK